MKGERLLALTTAALGEHPAVGEVRGRGLLVGVELVADRETRAPFPRTSKVVEGVVRGAREHGLLLYPGTGECEPASTGTSSCSGRRSWSPTMSLEWIVEVLADSVEAATAAVAARPG